MISLTEAAQAYGVTRQRVHEWLTLTGKLTACKRITDGKGRTLMLQIPVSLLKQAPFVTGESHAGRPPNSPKPAD